MSEKGNVICMKCRANVTERLEFTVDYSARPNYYRCLTCGHVWTVPRTLEASGPLKAIDVYKH